MSGKIKIVPTLFAVYDYDREEDYINAMSLKGWQLKKGGLFHQTYERSDQSYRYKLDFNNKVYFNAAETNRYMALFEEQGWEHINSTINGWHYFRKKYDPAAGEEAYELYTDDTSLREMHYRWIKISRIMQIFLLILMFCYLFSFITTDNKLMLFDFFLYIAVIALIELCIWHMKRKNKYRRSKTRLGQSIGYLLMVILLLTPFLAFFFAFYQPYIFKVTVTASEENTVYTKTLSISKDGFYGIYVKQEGDNGEVILTLEKDHRIVFRSGSQHPTSAWIELTAGSYEIEANYYPDSPDQMKEAEETDKDQVFIGIKKSLYR